MKLAMAAEMRNIDKMAINDFGIPEIVLMENASREISRNMRYMLGELRDKRICILCGTGNNGGDGLAAARHLSNGGAKVKIFLLGRLDRLTPSAAVNYNIVKNMGLEVQLLESAKDWEKLKVVLKFSDAIVDGLLGTGFKGELRESAKRLIDMANASELPVLAIDVPSGVVSDTGQAADSAIRADLTVTLGLPKWGTLFSPGAALSGRLVVDGIGIPQALLEDVDIKQSLIDDTLVKKVLLPRAMDVHKGSCGRILVIGGSRGMTGAPAMTAEAVLRAGAGIVTLAAAESLNDILEVKLTEVMTLPLAECQPGILGMAALDQLLEVCKAYDMAIIGPGLGRHEETQELVRQFVQQADVPLLIDADAIYALRGQGELLASCKYVPVLTPHMGEMAALLDISVPELRRELLDTVRVAAEEYNGIFAVKSECTIVVYPDGEAYATSRGNSSMATAGCGDVLAGTIGGLYRQTVEGMAALAGVYVHGLAGDLADEELGHGMMATDIIRKIPAALKKLN